MNLPGAAHAATPSPPACLTSQDSASPVKYPFSGPARGLLTW